MFRLASILYSIVSTTLAGTAVIVALVMGFDTLVPILVAVGAGVIAAAPVAYVIAKHLIAT
ncbi:MAG: CTP synthetase [Roseobacter sp.]